MDTDSRQYHEDLDEIVIQRIKRNFGELLLTTTSPTRTFKTAQALLLQRLYFPGRFSAEILSNVCRFDIQYQPVGIYDQDDLTVCSNILQLFESQFKISKSSLKDAMYNLCNHFSVFVNCCSLRSTSSKYLAGDHKKNGRGYFGLASGYSLRTAIGTKSNLVHPDMYVDIDNHFRSTPIMTEFDIKLNIIFLEVSSLQKNQICLICDKLRHDISPRFPTLSSIELFKHDLFSADDIEFKLAKFYDSCDLFHDDNIKLICADIVKVPSKAELINLVRNILTKYLNLRKVQFIILTVVEDSLKSEVMIARIRCMQQNISVSILFYGYLLYLDQQLFNTTSNNLILESCSSLFASFIEWLISSGKVNMQKALLSFRPSPRSDFVKYLTSSGLYPQCRYLLSLIQLQYFGYESSKHIDPMKAKQANSLNQNLQQNILLVNICDEFKKAHARMINVSDNKELNYKLSSMIRAFSECKMRDWELLGSNISDGNSSTGTKLSGIVNRIWANSDAKEFIAELNSHLNHVSILRLWFRQLCKGGSFRWFQDNDIQNITLAKFYAIEKVTDYLRNLKAPGVGILKTLSYCNNTLLTFLHEISVSGSVDVGKQKATILHNIFELSLKQGYLSTSSRAMISLLEDNRNTLTSKDSVGPCIRSIISEFCIYGKLRWIRTIFSGIDAYILNEIELSSMNESAILGSMTVSNYECSMAVLFDCKAVTKLIRVSCHQLNRKRTLGHPKELIRCSLLALQLGYLLRSSEDQIMVTDSQSMSADCRSILKIFPLEFVQLYYHILKARTLGSLSEGPIVVNYLFFESMLVKGFASEILTILQFYRASQDNIVRFKENFGIDFSLDLTSTVVELSVANLIVQSCLVPNDYLVKSLLVGCSVDSITKPSSCLTAVMDMIAHIKDVYLRYHLAAQYIICFCKVFDFQLPFLISMCSQSFLLDAVLAKSSRQEIIQLLSFLIKTEKNDKGQFLSTYSVSSFLQTVKYNLSDDLDINTVSDMYQRELLNYIDIEI